MKKIFLLLAFFILMSNSGWADDAYDAYQKGDYSSAFRIWMSAAEKGDATAQNNIGAMYYNGQGVQQDFAKALRWYRKAAEQGIADAQNSVGIMYYRGLFVQQDYTEALHWFRKAADQGYPEAQNNVGFMYHSGQCVQQDYAEALRWFRKAAEQGNDSAQASIGEIYEYGEGVQASYSSALKWYTKSAEQGNGVSKKAVERLSRGIWGVASLQRFLLNEGFDPGSVDNNFGDQTLMAAQNYHKANQLDTDANDITAIHNHISEMTKIRSSSPSPTEYTADSLKGSDLGTYYALVIGNKNYRYLNKLKTSINDAEAVAEILQTKYNFQVTKLIDANRSEIFEALGLLRNRLNINDNLLIYYAGHGDIDRSTERGYWLPVDAERINRANWIPNEDITNDLKAMQAKHVLIVSDSCYSGTLTRGVDTAKMKEGGKAIWVQRMAKSRSRTAMTSGGLEPVVDTGRGNHSVFANIFLKTLRENTEIIDTDSLFETIRRGVVLNARQTPKYEDIKFCGHDDGDFIWIPR